MEVWMCRSPRVDLSPDRLLRIYRADSVPRLLALHRALRTALAEATDATTRAFCEYRLPLVEQVLAEKQP
jgi:hypothetical protein